jgi:hypothetical protein
MFRQFVVGLAYAALANAAQADVKPPDTVDGSSLGVAAAILVVAGLATLIWFRRARR